MTEKCRNLREQIKNIVFYLSSNYLKKIKDILTKGLPNFQISVKSTITLTPQSTFELTSFQYNRNKTIFKLFRVK